ncbi:probable palmitoyltransferase ZDHHC24 isoform X2 [Cylas formicarius]|uniref:probable palmitoyltransferase ZDHHC24 isoform X2 n=1 Tax=Cylas formicarius TaxID=197179 RepID=UPI00295896AF|nr:probable palmitoyltransferase ZDHHC24 isoform X2 [Cylas formicarius]
MQIRTRIYPKNFGDACVTVFMFTIIPLIYYFELWVVLPKFYSTWSLLYAFHFCMGNFILLNVCSNLMAVILCDTSLKNKIIPSDGGRKWKFCSVCETVTPPRSWHCNTCNTCILKRDHHCMFTSCCIGHYNHRYFMVFVSYIFLATVYATYYNLYFIQDYIVVVSWLSVLKIVFPLATLFLEFTEIQLYVFFILVVMLGGFFTGTLLFYHLNLILKGRVTPERKEKMSPYDKGKIENFKIVFGERWYLVWLSPLIKSELPCDGINWETKGSVKGR